MISDSDRRRILFVLHRGLVELRLLALQNNNQQIADLSDALEQLPGILHADAESRLQDATESLRRYRTKFTTPPFDYVQYMDTDPPSNEF